MITQQDILFLRQAMALAQKGEGWVNPNPMVGAVIVRDGEVIASGYHERYRSLHAERNAFKYADEHGVDCTEATIYVTLEPCCHHGNQPPCTDAIIEHGIKRVVVGLCDPNPLVAGKGLSILRDKGIKVDTIDDGIGNSVNIDVCTEMKQLKSELEYQNRIFLKFITKSIPWVMAKWAMTLDGKTATACGDSKWITSSESRQLVHRMRTRHAAIMCGIGTVLADDPMLNVRLGDGFRQPVRVIADRHLQIPLDSQLVKTAREIPVVVVYSGDVDSTKKQQLNEAGVETIDCNTNSEILTMLASRKIDSLMIEGGGTLTESFMRDGLINEVSAFIAPKIVGGKDAHTPIDGEGIALMGDALRLHNMKVCTIGHDILVTGLITP